MSESIFYDVALTLIPEAAKMLREYDHPDKVELLRASSQLHLFVSSANERLRATAIPPEVQRFREVMRYGFLSLKRVFSDGDWRAHILFTELLIELEPLKYLLEWILQSVSLPPRSLAVEVNSVAPLFSARLATRMNASIALIQKRDVGDVSVVSEVVEEYFRRYDVNAQVVRADDLTNLGSLKSSADLVFFGSPDAWKVGWESILAITTALLKQRGFAAYLLPGNYREGFRTLLRFWGIAPFPEPQQVTERLRRLGFRDVRVNVQGCFYAAVAQRR